MFETKRLRLRAFEERDGAVFCGWWNDPELARWQTTGPVVPTTLAQRLEQLKFWMKDSLFYGCIERLEDGALVGMVNLWGGDAKNRDFKLAAIFGRDHWGQGYGQESLQFLVNYAFAHLGVRRISLQVAAENKRAIRCYEKVGFVAEGRLRAATFHDGAWEDELLMGMLVEDLR